MNDNATQYTHVPAELSAALEVGHAATCAAVRAGRDSGLSDRSIAVALSMIGAQSVADEIGGAGAAQALRAMADTFDRGETLLARDERPTDQSLN